MSAQAAGAFLADLTQLDQLVAAPSAIPGINGDSVRVNMVSSLLQRVANLPALPAADCTRIVVAVGEGGWSASQKAKIAAAVGRLQVLTPNVGPRT